MKYGISGAPLPSGLPYGVEIEKACELLSFSPLLAYAVKQNETGPADPPDVLQVGGNGHGIFQLDSSYPSSWADPYINALYAVAHFLLPAQEYWAALGFYAEDLIRLTAATFNEGLENAVAAHDLGNVDLFDTNNYGSRALVNYRALLGEKP
jgi:hypothetical protein